MAAGDSAPDSPSLGNQERPDDGQDERGALGKVQNWTKKQGDTWTMLKSLVALSGFAMLACVVYGSLYSPRGALLAFLAALLGYAIGGISGFLFGFPRYTEAAALQTIDDLRAATSQADGRSQRTSPLRQSTNLERITDWLMTMIVGATVVNLKDVGSPGTELEFAL